MHEIPPPDMITVSSQLSLYRKKLKCWSRLSTLDHQSQFDFIMGSISHSNPFHDKLFQEIGESKEAATRGVDIILDKLKEWSYVDEYLQPSQSSFAIPQTTPGDCNDQLEKKSSFGDTHLFQEVKYSYTWRLAMRVIISVTLT